MELFNSLAKSDELRMDYMLQPGEIQLLSNHTQLHTRAAFEDWDDIDQRRHLLRLWLAPPAERPLPESYKEIYGGSVEVRVSGGGVGLVGRCVDWLVGLALVGDRSVYRLSLVSLPSLHQHPHIQPPTDWQPRWHPRGGHH